MYLVNTYVHKYVYVRMHVCYIFVVASPAVNYVKEYFDFSPLFQKKKRKKSLVIPRYVGEF